MFKRRCIFISLSFVLVFINVHESRAKNGLSPFEKDGLWGYKDKKGKVTITARFIIANEFSTEGIAAVVDDKGWVYIDEKGKEIIRPYVFDNGPDYFQEGLARFTVNNKFGFFDKSGQIVIEPKFDFAYPFKDGLAAVCRGCKIKPMGEHFIVEGKNWMHINKEGKIVPQN